MTTNFQISRRRQLGPPKIMTGNERRWMNPNRGLIKLCERQADWLVSRFIYPLLAPLWNPYSWLLAKRFSLGEVRLSPIGWPQDLPPLRVLLISDIHAGIFLKPETLWQIVHALMQLKPDMVALCGDMVTGHVNEADRFLDMLAPLTDAPLGAWYCFGNHDYFGGDPDELRRDLAAIGIKTLKNESVIVEHGGGSFVLGGIDDRILGTPDWQALTAAHGAPNLLLAHNPDDLYEAAARSIPLILSGHTHGGQIRLPNGAPLIRQSRFCLDEGIYRYATSIVVVSRGLGSIVLPIRIGADPEAIMIEITPAS